MRLVKYLECNNEVELFIEENGTIFHQYQFLRCVGNDYVCFTILNDTNNVIAVLPLVKSVKNGLKSFHIPPFAYQFGPIISSNLAAYKKEKIITLLFKELKTAKHLDFKILLSDSDILAYKTNKFDVEANQTHIFNASKKYEIDILSKDKKRDIKKLFKLIKNDELTLVENPKDLKKDLLFLWKETSKRSKFNAHLEVLNNILNSTTISNYSNIIFDSKGNPIAATYCPFDNNTMYHLVGASVRLEDKRFDRANLISLYLAVSYANKLGLNFDFEGSNISGVANFYRMMGGTPRINFRVQKTKSIYYNVLKGIQRVKQLYL